MSKRYFKVLTIPNDGEDFDRRETSYETATTARVMLKRCGVHLGKNEKARGNHKYMSESGAWILYHRCSPDEVKK